MNDWVWHSAFEKQAIDQTLMQVMEAAALGIFYRVVKDLGPPFLRGFQQGMADAKAENEVAWAKAKARYEAKCLLMDRYRLSEWEADQIVADAEMKFDAESGEASFNHPGFDMTSAPPEGRPRPTGSRQRPRPGD